MRKVLIVGQGIAGTVLGYHLEAAGFDVTVADTPEQNSSSSVAAGALNPLVFKRMIPGWRAEEAAPYAIEFYKSIESAPGMIWKNVPVLKIFSDQKEREQWNTFASATRFTGYTIETLPGINGSYGGGIVNLSGYIDVVGMLAGYRTMLKQNEKFIHQAVNPEELQHADNKFRFNDLVFDDVVFCEGTGISKNKWFNYIKLVPAKGEMIEIEMNGPSPDYIYSRNLFLMSSGEGRWIAGSTFRWNDLELSPTDDCREELTSRLEKLVSAPFKIIRQYTGIRPATHDRRPVAGAHPEIKGLWVLNGFGAKGVLLAPIIARELVSEMSGIGHVHTEARVGRFQF